MRRGIRLAPLVGLAVLCLFAATLAGAQSPYFPERHDWQTKTPEEAGFDAALLEEAVEFAVASESDAPNDLALNHELTFAQEPFGFRIGPTTVRGALSGIVVKDGYIVREWGPSKKVDMTFSVSKTFLSTAVGLLYDKGLIASVDDRVGPLYARRRALRFGTQRVHHLGPTCCGRRATGRGRSSGSPTGPTARWATIPSSIPTAPCTNREPTTSTTTSG